MIRRSLGLACVAGLALACVPAVASAATIAASSAAPDEATSSGGGCSLREAVQAMNQGNLTGLGDCTNTGSAFGTGNTINLSAGTYTLSVAGPDENLNATGDLDPTTSAISGSLTIQGAGAGSTTITAAGGWNDRIIDHISGGASNTLTINDLTITGGNDTDGTHGGGAIDNTQGSGFPNLTLNGVRLTGNATNSFGGAIESGGGTTSISNSTIGPTNTAATAGGGVYTYSGTATISSTAIVNNTAGPGNSGGGGLNWLGATLNLTNSVISGNVNNVSSGTSNGGGAYLNGTTATIRGTTISGNTASGGTGQRAGGVDVSGAGSTNDFINSTVSGNTGGGIRNDNNGTINIALSTLGPSTTGGTGSGTVLDKGVTGSINVRGSVIQGAAPACATGFITSQNDNVFPLGDSSCGAATGNDVLADALLGSLTYNGGPSAGAPGFTQQINTQLPASNSPAVEHVPSASCTDFPSGALTVDQRGAGFPRPVDFDGSGTAQCDAGSVELQLPPPSGGGGGGGGGTTTTPPPSKKKCKKHKKRSAAAAKKCKKKK